MKIIAIIEFGYLLLFSLTLFLIRILNSIDCVIYLIWILLILLIPFILFQIVSALLLWTKDDNSTWLFYLVPLCILILLIFAGALNTIILENDIFSQSLILMFILLVIIHPIILFRLIFLNRKNQIQ